MKFLHVLFLATFLYSSASFASSEDTHPQLCDNIREKVSEDCSEESNTFNPDTGETIKRTYDECVRQDLAAVANEVTQYLTDEIGLYVFDKSGDKEEIECGAE